MAHIVARTSTEPHVCAPGCPDWPTDAEAPKAERKQLFRWSPSNDVIQTMLRAAGAGAGLLGLLGFGLSFRSVAAAAVPYLGGWSFVLPVIIDLGIAVLTLLGLTLALAGMPSRLVSGVPTLLSAYTLYLNCADQKSVYGAIIHGAGPMMWILVVEIGGLTVRKLVGLEHAKPRIERMRASLWLLRPFGTFRLWRQMRIQQIETYRAAIDRDAARAVVVGRMRLHHGRFWRSKAPLAERIALRLQGRDVTGVSAELTAHQLTADLLRGGPTVAEQLAEAETVPAAQTASAPASQTAAKAAPKASPSASRPKATPGTGRVRRVQPQRSPQQLAAEVEALEDAAIAKNGKGVSYRAAQAALGVRYADAKAAVDELRARRSAPVAPVVILPTSAPAAQVPAANGSAVA
jgi:hypothetical protein